MLRKSFTVPIFRWAVPKRPAHGMTDVELLDVASLPSLIAVNHLEIGESESGPIVLAEQRSF